MSVRWSKIWSLALALALMPGVFEVVENVAHLALERHLAHAEETGDHHTPSGPEHGCTPTAHLCECHASLVFVSPQMPPSLSLRIAGSFDPGDPRSPDPRSGPPVEHPPRA